MLSGEFEHGSVPREMLGPQQFQEVSKLLRDALKKQNYRMAHIEEAPDLLIVVHWGMTTLDYDYFLLEDGFGGGVEDPDAEEGFNDFSTPYEQVSDESLRRSAFKLGTVDLLSGESGNRIDQQRALADTSEERFYFVCIAYDFKKLLQREKQVSWITQFSVPIRGINHADAVVSMTRVAADFFGKSSTDITYTRTESGEETTVDIGELEVVEREGTTKEAAEGEE